MMDEEKTYRSPAHPRFRYKLIKIVTLTLLVLALFFALGGLGLKATSSSSFCSSCHEMKPEYYTLKASTHSEVDCVNCHTDPIIKKLAKDKTIELVDQLNHQSITSAVPIRMPNVVPDSACESCHNMKTRQVTPSGDIIIPHEKHMKEGVECTECHSGVAHGKIADRKMTYQTDLDKWDKNVGTQAMSDLKFTRPDMDTCMECHKAQEISTECKTCHKTGMVPTSHKKANFKTKTHGIQAGKDLKKCNQCHKDMSTQPLKGYDDVSTLTKFLNPNSANNQRSKNQFDYAKENTFCRDCHSKRPPSHNDVWMNDHGNQADIDKNKCLTCHNYQQAGDIQGITTVACSSCHPAMHKGFDKTRHPVHLTEHQKVTEFCYTCHVKKTCSACHKE